MKFYVETSVWSRLVDSSLPVEQETTRKFLESIRQEHELFISALVIRELVATPDGSLREKLLEAVKNVEPDLLASESKVVEI